MTATADAVKAAKAAGVKVKPGTDSRPVMRRQKMTMGHGEQKRRQVRSTAVAMLTWSYLYLQVLT